MTERPFATPFPGPGCLGELTTKCSFDLQASFLFVIGVLGWFFDMSSVSVCKTRHWHTSGRLVQELNACIVDVCDNLY